VLSWVPATLMECLYVTDLEKCIDKVRDCVLTGL
jgi:hypothetical protein